MPKPSKIARLPDEIRDLIGDLRSRSFTLDEIMAHLHRLDGVEPSDLPSRSGLGRHIQGLDQLSERLHRSRTVAEALVRKLGDAPESRQTRLNIELMHSMVTDLFLASESAEEGETVSMDAKTVHDLSKALDHLTRAAERDATHTLKLREETEKKTKTAANKAVEAVGREKGLSADTISAIKAQILGVKVGA